MEPVVVLMIPGLVLWLMLLCACTCFCYRRYRLGLCGEPIPTVKAYTPREICVSMTVVAVGCVLIVLASGAAVLVANASYEGAFDSLLAAGQSAEGALNSSISEGAEVLDAGLRMSASLDGFQKLLATEVDATTLGSDLQCSLDLLAALPNGATMLRTASAIGDATVVFPEDAVTDALFADLRRPQQRYPALVPPLQVSLATLQDRLAALPDLVLLADRLERLNTSVLNTSSVPSRIAAAMVGVNATLALLPDLSLLADRLSRVSHEQTGSEPHICASLPPGWQPGDVTECDLLQAQLRQARDTVERVDPELPLSLFSSYESLAADFPNLPEVTTALLTKRAELAACPNLTSVEADYGTLQQTMAGWSPTTIADSIGAVASAAKSLAGSNATQLIPELQTLHDSLTPLACLRQVLQQLTRVNASLLLLTPEVMTLYQRASALSLSLEAIPSPLAFVKALQGLTAALSALPLLPAYTAGVATISVALGAMPGSNVLRSGLTVLEQALALPESHEGLSNSTATLYAAMSSLPAIAPFRSSLESLNASRAELPSLIGRAIDAIDRYDTSGTTVGLSAILTAIRAAVQRLHSTIQEQPDDVTLRRWLAEIDAEFSRTPATQPTVEQSQRLAHAVHAMPDLAAYLSGMTGLLTATAAAPSVDALSGTWIALNASLLLVPSFDVTGGPLEVYTAEQARLPTPPTRLLDGAIELHGRLAAVAARVTYGKASLSRTFRERQEAMGLLQRGLLGDQLDGYFSRMSAYRPAIESGWWIFLTVSFAFPAALAALAVVSCITRTGRPALHAGHGLLSLLPWYMLLGASIELPLALMLQDSCQQVPWLTRRLTHFLSTEAAEVHRRPQFAAAGEPIYGWVTGCPEADPLADYLTPIVTAADVAQYNATRDFASLQLRAEVRKSVTELSAESLSVAAAAEGVHSSLACSKFHDYYLEMHNAICCDLGYAFTAMWCVRLVTAWAMLASAVAAIAGYKRFRRPRDLWGPYHTVQALEVGAYL